MPIINSLLDKWSSQIRSAVEEANIIHGDKEPSLEEWKESVEFLRYSINQSLY
jgi:hypothetical protein